MSFWQTLLRPFNCFSLGGEDASKDQGLTQAPEPAVDPSAYEQQQLQPTSSTGTLLASPKRKRDEDEVKENVFTQPSEPTPARKRPSIQDPAVEMDEWESMRSPTKSIPRTPLGAGEGFAKDSFKFTPPLTGDFKTPIGGGTFLTKQKSSTATGLEAPSQLPVVNEDAGGKIKAQHSMSAVVSDLAPEPIAEDSALDPALSAADTTTPAPAAAQPDKDTVPGMKTPAYLLSASSAEDSPHVSGKSNPVTNFKEGKPVRAHSTPFEDRVAAEVEREGRFSNGAKHEFRGRLSDIVANQAMQLRSSPAPSNARPWR